MKRILNFRDFSVFVLEKEVWDLGYHNHNCYEIVLIDSGSGYHRLNEITFPYKKGDVYLLSPSNAHEFIIEEKTQFIYIKFTERFVTDNFLIQQKQSLQMLEYLFLNRPVIAESMIKDKSDIEHFFVLGKMLLGISSRSGMFKNELISQIFSAIIIILARNLAQYAEKKKWIKVDGEKIENILSYISVYATDNEKIRITNIARKFAMSESYISIFVKKHTGLSIQNHVMLYRIKMAEKLLYQSRFNINEIAERTGFNDASHFNKMFRKYREISPTAFRAQVRN